jgi:hypothetical protein
MEYQGDINLRDEIKIIATAKKVGVPPHEASRSAYNN